VIAVYGKGASVNPHLFDLSAAFSKLGKRVAQVGCDPKHTGTFTLQEMSAHGEFESSKTWTSPQQELRLKDFVFEGLQRRDVALEIRVSPGGTGCGAM